MRELTKPNGWKKRNCDLNSNSNSMLGLPLVQNKNPGLLYLQKIWYFMCCLPAQDCRHCSSLVICYCDVDVRIIKVGVAVCDDAKRLMSDYGVATRGCVDLRKAVIRCSTESDQRWILNRGVGLQSLADTILHVNLDKSPHVRRSDWEAEQLSTEQVIKLLSNNLLKLIYMYHSLSDIICCQ